MQKKKARKLNGIYTKKNWGGEIPFTFNNNETIKIYSKKVIQKKYNFYSYFISTILIPFYIIRNFSIPYHYLRFINYIKPNYSFFQVSSTKNWKIPSFSKKVLTFPIEFVNVCIPCFWITKRKPTSEKNSNVLFFFTRQTTFNWGWNKCPRQHLVHSRTLTSYKLPIIKFMGFKNCLVLFFIQINSNLCIHK